MMLSRVKVLQMIRDGKKKLDIEDFKFSLKYSNASSKIGKKAEIFILSEDEAEVVLYPTAAFFSVRHELCHAKLFRMGIRLTNTEKDRVLFPDVEDYTRVVVTVEWYINELQRQVFREYYAVDGAGAPRPPPFEGLPPLPRYEFTDEEIKRIMIIATGKEPTS